MKMKNKYAKILKSLICGSVLRKNCGGISLN